MNDRQNPAADSAGRSNDRATSWIAKLDDAPAVLQLPTDRARPTVLGSDRGFVSFTLTGTAVAAAERLAVAADTDLYGVLLSAWQVLLVRYTDEADVVIGCGRPGPGRDGGVEVIRQRVEPHASFGEVVKVTAAELREAAALGPVSVAELLAALGAEPGAGKHPVFQVGFAQQQDGNGAEVASPDHAPCDVVLRWTRQDDAVAAVLDFSPDLFDRPRMERMAAHLSVLLQSAAAEPDTAVATLPLLTDAERERLTSWNATEHPHDVERPLSALFAEQVQRSPHAVAVEFGDERVTYAELDRRANRLAAALQAAGVGPDVTVAISMERSVQMVLSVLAVLKAGGAYVPVDATYPESRQTHMLQNSGARLLLVHGGQAPPASVTGDARVVDLDGDDLRLDTFDESAPVSQATGDSLGYVIYTSGSTGQPKGVALPQSALTNLVEWQLRRPDFAPGARVLQFSSLSFDVSFQEMFTTWCSGGTLVLVRDALRRDPRGLLDILVTGRVQRLFLPFVALRGLADAAVSSGRFPEDLREVYTAGEQLQVDDTVRAFFSAMPGCLLENQYGPSESHVVTAHTLEGEPASWPALPSIGRPISNTTISILDATGAPRPLGIPGELYIGGVCLARGYMGRPDLTEERFVRSVVPELEGRLYRTGDLARWLEDGTIDFLGRADNQVKFRGFRIEPGEVGAVMSSFPGVRQCVATVADVAGVGPRLAAYVLPAEGAQVRLDELHRYARERLPDYMVPSHVTLVDAFPLTSSGKVDVQGLPQPTFDRRILDTEHEPPSTDLERSLAEIWQQLLGVADIGVRDDFFDLGGDSLMAVEMFVRIEERFGRQLPLGALAQDPTIAGLAGQLSATDGAEWKSLVPLQPEGSGVPLFCIHGGYGNVASFPRLVRSLPEGQRAYALQWDGLDGSRGSRSIPEMAHTYVKEVRAVQPSGPYHLAGQCIGGLVALEMARELRTAGEEVATLVLYDSPNVYSPAFRFVPGLPAVPDRLRKPVNGVVGMVSNLARLLLGKRPPVPFLRVRLMSALGRRVTAVQDREHYGEMVMVRAAWRYRPEPVDAPVTLIHTALRSGAGIAMVGTWHDGMMGWSQFGSASPRFNAHHIKGKHNHLPYEPEAVALLQASLRGSDDAPAA